MKLDLTPSHRMYDALKMLGYVCDSSVAMIYLILLIIDNRPTFPSKKWVFESRNYFTSGKYSSYRVWQKESVIIFSGLCYEINGIFLLFVLINLIFPLHTSFICVLLCQGSLEGRYACLIFIPERIFWLSLDIKDFNELNRL